MSCPDEIEAARSLHTDCGGMGGGHLTGLFAHPPIHLTTVQSFSVKYWGIDLQAIVDRACRDYFRTLSSILILEETSSHDKPGLYCFVKKTFTYWTGFGGQAIDEAVSCMELEDHRGFLIDDEAFPREVPAFRKL
jgi:hypothetical protein